MVGNGETKRAVRMAKDHVVAASADVRPAHLAGERGEVPAGESSEPAHSGRDEDGWLYHCQLHHEVPALFCAPR